MTAMSGHHRCLSRRWPPLLGFRLHSISRLAHFFSAVPQIQGAGSNCGNRAAHQDSHSEVVTSEKWKIVRRPVLDIELRRYAQSPVVPQALVLHGPRGVGKRTTIEGLLQEWRKAPHAVAYVDLGPQQRAPSEGGCTPPWTLTKESVALTEDGIYKSQYDLGKVRQHLEQALESLALEAVEAGCLNSQTVLKGLLDHHAIDGALSRFLHRATNGVHSDDIGSISTKRMWKEALRHMSAISGHLSSTTAAPNSGRDPRNALESTVHLKEVAGVDQRLNAKKEKAALSLALAKRLLLMQEEWRLEAGAARRNRGAVPKGMADAAVSWPVLLLHLLSWATQEGLFQPKLVIHAMDVMRKAALDRGGVDGAAYHDSLLLHLVRMGITQGCLPIILVSSDSYYSWQLYEDFGDTDVFISREVFGWTPQEAALHLVPGVVSEAEWRVVSGVLGPNPRHLAELQFIRQSHVFSELIKEDDSTTMEDSIDLYLAYLQVTAVDPAIDVALGLLQEFADKARLDHISSHVLQHGAPWRHPPKTPHKDKQHQWAQLQIMDLIQALAKAEFGVNYLGGGKELLDDPAALALVEVGLLYQQRAPPYIRPTSIGFMRCLVRWLVRQKLSFSSADSIRYFWHRVARGRSYRHLMMDS